MTVKSSIVERQPPWPSYKLVDALHSISLTDEQHSFAKALVEAGRYSSVSAVLQQGIDLLRQRMLDEDLQRAALKALLDQRAAGAFVTGAQMDKSIARVISEKRRAHAVQN